MFKRNNSCGIMFDLYRTLLLQQNLEITGLSWTKHKRSPGNKNKSMVVPARWVQICVCIRVCLYVHIYVCVWMVCVCVCVRMYAFLLLTGNAFLLRYSCHMVSSGAHFLFLVLEASFSLFAMPYFSPYGMFL